MDGRWTEGSPSRTIVEVYDPVASEAQLRGEAGAPTDHNDVDTHGSEMRSHRRKDAVARRDDHRTISTLDSLVLQHAQELSIRRVMAHADPKASAGSSPPEAH